MTSNLDASARPWQRPRGFTMVELLVVIVIIVILIGLLVPAVGAVRRIARETASKAVIQTLETGLETFKADAKLGGAYPPSYSDDPSGRTANPYILNDTEGLAMTGAGLLVWALSGADLLGTPGFKRFGGYSTWAASMGNTFNGDASNSEAYALDVNRQPVQPRYGPYVDGSKVKVTRNESRGQSPDFVIPEELKACQATNVARPLRPYPLYLDSFGYPVLYWRADPAGKALADRGRGEMNVARGLYHWEDNSGLVDLAGQDPRVLVLNRAGEPHLLGWDDEFRGNSNPSVALTRPSFPRYIWDSTTQARYNPQRPDTFLLATPGFDGRFGTADDVTNFEHHGQ